MNGPMSHGGCLIGIEAISCNIPTTRISSLDKRESFEISQDFLENKIGVLEVARKPAESETSDLAEHSVRALFDSEVARPEEIGCLAVVTQNPDGFGLPHTSAILHGRLGLPNECACFDISLGCSGYVQGLSILSSFMSSNGMKKGLLVTADPYSKIIDPTDRDTALLFGDAASVTLLSDAPVWRLGRFAFGTRGKLHDALQVGSGRKLAMNGRAVFNFSAMEVPGGIKETLSRNDLTIDQIDRVVLHQGSKYIVDTIGKRIGVPEKTQFYAREYGNAVSSSIPIILANHLAADDRRVLIAGFGVGLSWATTVLEKSDQC